MKSLAVFPGVWNSGGRQEISGAFGDVGVLFPLALSLILVNGLNPTSVFLGAGLTYLGAGLFFRIPMPVQPLKAVASIAIGAALPPGLISAAGVLIALILLSLSATGAISFIARIISTTVIKGIQLTLGVMLMKAGLDLILKPQLVSAGGAQVISVGSLQAPTGILLGLGSVVFLIALIRKPLLPASFALLSVGIILGLLSGARADWGFSQLGPVLPSFAVPEVSQWLSALVLLVIPQLPLSLGNAVLSTADVAREYYGERAARVTPKAICTSMGLANLAIGLLGGMPVCHGAGGLTAHHRLGARTPLASIIIGSTCVILALVFGKLVAPIVSLIPYAVLGALLLYVGWRHTGLVARVHRYRDILVIVVVAIVSLGVNNLAVGVVGGVLLERGLKLSAWRPVEERAREGVRR